MDSSLPLETTPYYERAIRVKHPEVKDEWVERVLANPHHVETQADGRLRYYGYIAEERKWIRVIIDDGKLHNRCFDHTGLKRWGIP